MSNKMLDNDRFDKLWKDIKTIKVFTFAEEKSYERGIRCISKKSHILEMHQQVCLSVDIFPSYPVVLSPNRSNF